MATQAERASGAAVNARRCGRANRGAAAPTNQVRYPLSSAVAGAYGGYARDAGAGSPENRNSRSSGSLVLTQKSSCQVAVPN